MAHPNCIKAPQQNGKNGKKTCTVKNEVMMITTLSHLTHLRWFLFSLAKSNDYQPHGKSEIACKIFVGFCMHFVYRKFSLCNAMIDKGFFCIQNVA